MENEILRLLQGTPGTRFSYKEVGRILDRRQYRNDLHWARPVLERLVFEGIILKDGTLYFIPREDEEGDTQVIPCGGGAIGAVESHELKIDPGTRLVRVKAPVDS